jgi:hypothetical protein
MCLSPMYTCFWLNYCRTSSSIATTRASTFLMIASTHLRHSPRAPCVCGIPCGYLDTINPDHNIDHDDPSHDYLDQGCTTQRSQLTRHHHKCYHLAWAPYWLLLQFKSSHCDTIHDAPLRIPLVSTLVISSSLTVHNIYAIHIVVEWWRYIGRTHLW